MVINSERNLQRASFFILALNPSLDFLSLFLSFTGKFIKNLNLPFSSQMADHQKPTLEFFKTSKLLKRKVESSNTSPRKRTFTRKPTLFDQKSTTPSSQSARPEGFARKDFVKTKIIENPSTVRSDNLLQTKVNVYEAKPKTNHIWRF